MIALLMKAGKGKILAGVALSIAVTAFLDFAVGSNVSLAPLYILPMMLGAVVLRPWETGAIAILCSFLRALFDTAGSPAELTLRFVFAAAAYFVSGLFVTELVRNHELDIRHLKGIQLEQAFRREAEDQLRFLVDSSPAAIVTMDSTGRVLAANAAANKLLMTSEQDRLTGRMIGEYLPVLADALKMEVGRQGLRTAAQCQGRRHNGEIFAAHTWFSSYSSIDGTRLAAIVVDSSEELREREEQGLRELLRGNRIVAAAFSHEVRNFCVTMRMLCTNVQERHGLANDPDVEAMATLLAGVENAASLQLHSRSTEAPEPVSLREVLDNLRIVVESEWREIDGIVQWHIPREMPDVLAEPHGLLQAFMNLCQNSYRAVRDAAERRLEITVTMEARNVFIRFHDSGPGLQATAHLFQAFQPGASGSGLGLYVSRSIVRSFGGDLRAETSSDETGAVFVVQVQAVR
jgi:two-component system, LuxR family, sensor kinase FixL